MHRHTAALKIKAGNKADFRHGIKTIWNDLKKSFKLHSVSNFSVWEITGMVFIYYETDLPVSNADTEISTIFESLSYTFDWISKPTEQMQLMYEDFGFVRENKELIRHRVFVTKLHEGMKEEYKKRHDRLVEARGGIPSPGPDSNFSIWHACGYIFGYDEIDTTMETDESEKDHENTIRWESRMLEIMDWLTDDVDWLTGLHHPHIERIAYYIS